jgi:carbonic anhydrase
MSRTHDVTISAFDLDRIEAELEHAKRMRDEYKDLLIRVLYDDLFVHRNMGEAVRDLKILMGAIQLTDALSAMEGGSDE